MSRIDEIKKVVLDYPAPRDFELAVPAFKAQIYIEHLLSRLKIAEKALEEASEKLDKISSKDLTNGQLRYEAESVIQTALQQIRS